MALSTPLNLKKLKVKKINDKYLKLYNKVKVLEEYRTSLELDLINLSQTIDAMHQELDSIENSLDEDLLKLEKLEA